MRALTPAMPAAARSGMALVIVVSMLVLMVSIATSYLLIMQEVRGSGEVIATKQRLQIFVRDIQTRLIAQLEADAAEENSYTCFKDDWYMDHLSLAPDGSPAWIDEEASNDTMVNVNAETQLWYNWGEFNMARVASLPIPQGDFYQQDRRAGMSRWRYVSFLDDHLQPVETEDEARYALRYASAIFDNDALLSVHPDFPDPPGVVASSDSRFGDHLRYQNYLTRNSRALRNMASMYNRKVQRLNANTELYPNSPWDQENLNPGPDGSWRNDMESSGYAIELRSDPRLFIDGLFRRSGVFLRSNAVAYTSHLSGPLSPQNWVRTLYVLPHFGFPNVAGTVYYGRSPGLRNEALGGQDDCSVAWRLNLLTAPRRVLGMAVFGLNDRSWLGSAASLMGRGYPESMPLDREAGRYVSIIGHDDGYGTVKFPSCHMLVYSRADQVYTSSSFDRADWQKIDEAARLDIFMDLIGALDHATAQVRHRYNKGTGLAAGDPESYFTGPDLDPTFDDDTPADIQRELLREMFRMLGEPTITEVSGVPTSVDGILSGNIQLVGYDGKMQSPSWHNIDRHFYSGKGDRHFWGNNSRKQGFLPPGTNSRAIEYLFNDVCMSLFGTANPDFDPATDSDAKRAVDFNGDGMAESTLNGWWNGSRTIWSWWWDGVGPTISHDTDLHDGVLSDDVPDWMQQGTWYRFDAAAGGSGILRWNGSDWQELSSTFGSSATSLFLDCNDAYLRSSGWPAASARPGHADSSPILPFSLTGRLFVGNSRAFTLFIRSHLFDLARSRVVYRDNREVLVRMDVNDDGVPGDHQVVLVQPFMVKEEIED